LVPALVFWGALATLGNDKDSPTYSKDISFIKGAAQGDQAEVQLGKLAAEKGQNPQIKELGQRLAQDHSKANQDLMPIAQKCGVTLPNDQSWMEKLETKNLQNKSGADFDKAFAEHAIKDHEKDIDRFQKAQQDCKDPDLKAFIEKTLPVLREHLQMARNAGSAVGVDERTLASADRYLSDQTAQMSGTVNQNQVERSQGLGRAPGSESGTATGGNVPSAPTTLKHPAYGDLPVAVQNTVKAEGDPQNIRDIRTTSRKGQTLYVVKTQRDGKNVTLYVDEDGTIQKGNWLGRLFGR